MWPAMRVVAWVIRPWIIIPPRRWHDPGVRIRRPQIGTADIDDRRTVFIVTDRTNDRFLIDTADDLIFVLNGFGYFSMINKNGANTLGYTPDDMIGHHFLEFIDKEDESKIAMAFSEILNSNKVTTFEAVFLDRYDDNPWIR